MTIRDDHPGFEGAMVIALARLVEGTSAPDRVWTAVEAAVSTDGTGRWGILPRRWNPSGLLTLPHRLPARSSAISAVAIVIATISLAVWALLGDGRAPSSDQAGSAADVLQVWELEDGSWLTGGEELTRLVALFDASSATVNASPYIPGSDATVLAESLSNLFAQPFSVSSDSTPYAPVPQAAHLGATEETPWYRVPPDWNQSNPQPFDPLRDDGRRQWVDPGRLVWANPGDRLMVEGCEEWTSAPTLRLEFDPVTAAGDLPKVITITSFKCLVQDASSGFVVGESYFGPASARSVATVDSAGDFLLRKESRPAGSIWVMGTTFRGTVTEWRTIDGELQTRTELITGEAPQDHLTAEWSHAGLRFGSDASGVDWLMATQFYAPIERLNGSLLTTAFDSVEVIEDTRSGDTLTTFKAVRQHGPSGREEWKVVVDINHMRPIEMTIVTGTGDWQQSATFEFTYDADAVS